MEYRKIKDEVQVSVFAPTIINVQNLTVNVNEVQDNDGGGRDANDLESLRGKPLSASMYLTFEFWILIFVNIKLCLLFIWTVVSVSNVAASAGERSKWKRK